MGANLVKVIFQPPMPPTYSCDPNLLWLTTSGNETIPAFYIPKQDAHFTFLFSHGNAEDLGIIATYLHEMSYKANVNIFAYEYTGYGMSTGSPKEEAVYQDVEAAFKYLRDNIGTPWNQIISYGRSIGSGPTCHLAARTAVRGIVLQSPMMSIYRIPFHFRFSLAGDVFANIDKVKRVCCPVFIIHGTRDEIVPVWHGQGLYEACVKRGIAHKPHWIPGGDHNNIESQAGDIFFDELAKFLQHLEQTPAEEMLLNQAEKHPL